jgi:hypothetical protein
MKAFSRLCWRRRSVEIETIRRMEHILTFCNYLNRKWQGNSSFIACVCVCVCVCDCVSLFMAWGTKLHNLVEIVVENNWKKNNLFLLSTRNITIIMFLGSKVWWVCSADNLTAICVGSITSHNPIGHHGLIQGIDLLYGDGVCFLWGTNWTLSTATSSQYLAVNCEPIV